MISEPVGLDTESVLALSCTADRSWFRIPTRGIRGTVDRSGFLAWTDSEKVSGRTGEDTVTMRPWDVAPSVGGPSVGLAGVVPSALPVDRFCETAHGVAQLIAPEESVLRMLETAVALSLIHI